MRSGKLYQQPSGYWSLVRGILIRLGVETFTQAEWKRVNDSGTNQKGSAESRPLSCLWRSELALGLRGANRQEFQFGAKTHLAATLSDFLG